MSTQTPAYQAPAPSVSPFVVIVTRRGIEYRFDVRGTHDMLCRLCERIDRGEAHGGQTFGRQGAGDASTRYDDRGPRGYLPGVRTQLATVTA